MIKVQSNIDSVDEYSLRTIAPDLTPLIDIIFILIVFLILTSNPAIVELMVDLPEKQESQLTSFQQDEKSVILKIEGDNNFSLLGEELTNLPTLKTKLSEIEDYKELVIAGDKKISLETFLSVLSIIEELKIKNTRVLMGE